MTIKAPVITIDGPSGAGKSTLSKIIAYKLNWPLFESGQVYRRLAFLVLQKNINIVEKNILPLVQKLDLLSCQKNNSIKDINFQIISEIASQLAIYPKIRQILLDKQRAIRKFPGLVTEGRDMGSTVFPDAIIKFFLDADLSTRVKRRMLALKKYGYKISFQELYLQMKKRDDRDQNRLISPLCISKNAIILNSTNMNIKDVTSSLMKSIAQKINI